MSAAQCWNGKLDIGESLRVDTGCIAAFASTVKYDIQFLSGFKNVLFGGEGMFPCDDAGSGQDILTDLTLLTTCRPYYIRFTEKSRGNKYWWRWTWNKYSRAFIRRRFKLLNMEQWKEASLIYQERL
jgi:hypothetical protein